jgi:hypothetical protein
MKYDELEEGRVVSATEAETLKNTE